MIYLVEITQHVMILFRPCLEFCLFLQCPKRRQRVGIKSHTMAEIATVPSCTCVQGLSLSLHLLFKYSTLPFITAESFSFAPAERLIRNFLLTTNTSHALGVTISNFWGPAQQDFFMGYYSGNDGYRSVISAQLGVPLSN